MNSELYQDLAGQFYSTDHNYADQLFDGLVSEAHEVYDALNEEQIIDELGDVLWYVTTIANSLEVSLEELMLKNINKLERRKLSGKITSH